MAEAVERLTREYLDLVYETFPTEATLLGRHEHDGRLEDLTEAGLDRFARQLADLRRRVTAVQDVERPGHTVAVDDLDEPGPRGVQPRDSGGRQRGGSGPGGGRPSSGTDWLRASPPSSCLRRLRARSRRLIPAWSRAFSCTGPSRKGHLRSPSTGVRSSLSSRPTPRAAPLHR